MIYAQGTLIKHRKGYTEVADGTTDYSGSAWSPANGSDSGETENNNPQSGNNGQNYTPPENHPERNIEAPVNSDPTPDVTRINNAASGNISIPATSLQPGMTGSAVRQLQDYLVSQGYMTQEQVNTGYGIYGPQTTAAVRALQGALGVDNTTGPGYFGPRTIAAIQAGSQDQNQNPPEEPENDQDQGNQPAGETREQIQAKIEDIKQQIATAQDQYIKEAGVQSLVEEAAKMGIEYPSEYLASLIEPQKPEAERRQEIYDRYGITNLESEAFQRPEKTFQQIYEQALIDNGLTSKQAELTAAQAELDKATADYNAAVGDANKNPWKNEAGRVGAVRRITESYQPEASRLQNRVTNLQSQVDNIKADAKDIAARTLAELEAEIQLDQQQLDYLTRKAENELAAQTATYKEETSKELLRYYPEYVKNMAKESKSTQVIEIGGQKIMYAFDDDGNVINKTVLGASGSGSGTGTASGIFTKAKISQMAAGGLDEDVAETIYSEILKGTTLEEIRDMLRAAGLDIFLLDVFDRVNDIRSIVEGSGPNKGTGTTGGEDSDWEAILNALQ